MICSWTIIQFTNKTRQHPTRFWATSIHTKISYALFRNIRHHQHKINICTTTTTTTATSRRRPVWTCWPARWAARPAEQRTAPTPSTSDCSWRWRPSCWPVGRVGTGSASTTPDSSPPPPPTDGRRPRPQQRSPSGIDAASDAMHLQTSSTNMIHVMLVIIVVLGR